MQTGLSVVLWAVFLAIIIAGAGILLRACGFLMPFAVATLVPAWDFCPLVPGSLSAEAERGETLRKTIRQLERDLADKAMACASIPPPPPPPLELPTQTGRPRPQQTALLKPPPPPPPPPKPPEPPKVPSALPADRWEQKDLSLLQGCWLLGEASPIDYLPEHCMATAGTLCFDTIGNGEQEQRHECPASGTRVCRARVTARFVGDGRLIGDQADGPCVPNSYWVARTLICRRINDLMASCEDTDRSGTKQVTLRRAP